MEPITVVALVLGAVLVLLFAVVAYVVKSLFRLLQTDWQEHLGNDPKK